MSLRPLRHLLVVAQLVTLAAPPLTAQQTDTPLAIAEQGSFFVGGHDISSGTLSTLPPSAPFTRTGTITVDQMYVRYQVPVGAEGRPITLIHGCCLTAKTWETTPDGRMGWDEYLLRKRRPVYLVDQVSRGRSAADPSAINRVKLDGTAADQLPTVFTASHEAAWTLFRFGAEYPRAYPGLQYPLDAVGELWKQIVPDWTFSLPTPNPAVAAISELAVRLGGTVLVSHSQSGIFPFQAAALTTNGIAGIVAIEPESCPNPNGDLAPYMRIPILVLWADNVQRSSFWAPRLKACQEFAAAVAKRGGHAENVELPTIGIKGNSHMLMQDRNNREVADWLLAWIDRNTTGPVRQ